MTNVPDLKEHITLVGLFLLLFSLSLQHWLSLNSQRFPLSASQMLRLKACSNAPATLSCEQINQKKTSLGQYLQLLMERAQLNKLQCVCYTLLKFLNRHFLYTTTNTNIHVSVCANVVCLDTKSHVAPFKLWSSHSRPCSSEPLLSTSHVTGPHTHWHF